MPATVIQEFEKGERGAAEYVFPEETLFLPGRKEWSNVARIILIRCSTDDTTTSIYECSPKPAEDYKTQDNPTSQDWKLKGKLLKELQPGDEFDEVVTIGDQPKGQFQLTVSHEVSMTCN